LLYRLTLNEIEDKISKRDIRIAFIGLGRVGLPLAAILADNGFNITGVDIKETVVRAINAGNNPYPDETGLCELINTVFNSGKLTATTSISEIEGSEIIIIAVPTLIKTEEPDIEAVANVAEEISNYVKTGSIIVLQSTVPPGTTEGMLGALITKHTGFKAGEDFGLAYSPERTQSPQVLKDLQTYPKIIGGIDEKSIFILSEIYSSFVPSIIKMNSIIAAEMDKVIENSYRDVNIAFANELAMLCQLYGVDVEELISTANSQPHCHILQPGLVGGHCIPMDPYYLISDAKRRGMIPKIMQAARSLNESMFGFILGMIEPGMKRVTILGLSFKPDVKSFDTSHSLKLINLLIEKGYHVQVHDPFLDEKNYGFNTESDLFRALTGVDCLILSTAHSDYKSLDFKKVKTHMNGNLVIDIRNYFNPGDVHSAGLRYKGLGRTLYD